MKGTLVVDTPQDYEAWLKERAELSGTQTQPPPVQRPSGEPPVGPTPGTIPPPGAGKPQATTAQPQASPGAQQQSSPPAPGTSPSPGG